MTLPTVRIPISKVDDEKRFVFGWGNVPIPGDVAKEDTTGGSGQVVANSEQSMEETISDICLAYCDQFSGQQSWAWVLETYDSYVLAVQEDWSSGTSEVKYVKQPYVIMDDDSVTFGAATEVERAWVTKQLETSETYGRMRKNFTQGMWDEQIPERLIEGVRELAKLRKIGPKVDYQGDIVPTYELESAAYNFVLESRNGSVNHTGEIVSEMIESFYATQEKYLALGITEEVAKTLHEGWWVGFHISNDDVWAGVKDGTYKMFSIGGRAISTPLIGS